MHAVIAGASGLLGTNLMERLRVHGHQVTQLVRRTPETEQESRWDPQDGRVDDAVIASADVVINTAGASLLANPHSRRWASEMRESRISTTRTLAESIARAGGRPAFLVGNGSSVYGDHGSEPVTEESESRGDALLTQITREWQAAAEPAKAAGSRVCILRTAPVAAHNNPLFKLQLPLFRLGLGARLGNGEQYFPIISLRDWVGAVAYLAESHDLSGPFNLCCPRTPTNAEFTAALASHVSRPAFLAVPSPVLRLAGGPMAPEMLNSINMRPAALERAGYDFEDEDVREVLASSLG